MVLASAGKKSSLDEWKTVANQLNIVAENLEPAGLKTGYHNHQLEFTPVGGQRPMEILAKLTKPSVMLQLDVGTCLEAGSDPVARLGMLPYAQPCELSRADAEAAVARLERWLERPFW